ncbi:MAG: hypothetical protein HY327_06095 [Chloroflexi bacterium]|nr:hypothetical protein [Chloroflexota bacterium]
MSTITIEISDKLAERLETHRDQLSQILERGLSQIEADKESADDLRARTIRALESTGLIQNLDLTSLVKIPHNYKRQPPLKIPGKPLSEMIIEQRGKL